MGILDDIASDDVSNTFLNTDAFAKPNIIYTTAADNIEHTIVAQVDQFDSMRISDANGIFLDTNTAIHISTAPANGIVDPKQGDTATIDDVDYDVVRVTKIAGMAKCYLFRSDVQEMSRNLRA